MEERLKNGLRALGVPDSDEIVSRFLVYKELLLSWNEKMNLTAITDEEGIAVKHFLDSVAVHDNGLIKESASVIDVGTGAGFPGIPVKIIREDIRLTLLDSLNKRLIFLNEVIKALGFKDTVCIHKRAEDGGRDGALREQFDVAVARAVSNMSTLSEYCLPFVKVGGVFLAYKSGHIEEELQNAKKAISELGGEIEEVKNLILPDTDLKRTVVVVRKVRQTPTKYPRQGGKPAKKPIG